MKPHKASRSAPSTRARGWIVTMVFLALATVKAAPAASQEKGVHASDKTLILVRVETDGSTFVRTLAFTDELERLRAEGRHPMPTFEKARGLGDLGGCFLVDADAVDELTNEVTCGGGIGLDTEFDPIGDMENELDPQVDPDAGDGRDRDEPPTREQDRSGEDYSDPGSAEADFEYAAGLQWTRGEFHLCGTAFGKGGCTSEIKSGSGDSLATEDELRQKQESDASEEEDEPLMAEKFLESLAAEAEGSEQAEEGESSIIAKAAGALFDWLEEHAEEEEPPADQKDPPSDESSTERPKEGDVVTAPAECEDEVAERLGGRVDPIDPHPDDAGQDGAYVGCFADATVVQDLAGCVIDLAARRNPEQDSLCAGQEIVLEVEVMTRNDLVIDDMAPHAMARATVMAAELAARLELVRAVRAGRAFSQR